MAGPTNVNEYLKRFNENQKISGFGPDTTCHVPCPFCAAPDFASWRIMDTHSSMAENRTCVECGRSSKALFQRRGMSTGFEIVQTGGPDQPEWLTPKMRRVDT